VSADEWKAGGFKRKHVCKKCFETKVPNPHYYTITRYMKATRDGNETRLAKLIQKRNPDLTLDEAERIVRDNRRRTENMVRKELVKVWDKCQRKHRAACIRQLE
jgi:hypothetical protein